MMQRQGGCTWKNRLRKASPERQRERKVGLNSGRQWTRWSLTQPVWWQQLLRAQLRAQHGSGPAQASWTACSSRGSGPARTWVSRSCTSCPTAVCLSCVSAAAFPVTQAAQALAGSRRQRCGPSRSPPQAQGEVAWLPGTPAPSSSELLGRRSPPPGGRAAAGGWGWCSLAPGTLYRASSAAAGVGATFLSGWGLSLATPELGEAAQLGEQGCGGPRGHTTLKLLSNISLLVGPRSPNRG